jgi:hypothetical protein
MLLLMVRKVRARLEKVKKDGSYIYYYAANSTEKVQLNTPVLRIESLD